MPRLARIALYPIKSLDPISVDAADLLPCGALKHDRQFALVDVAGRFVNGKRTDLVHRLETANELVILDDLPHHRLGGGDDRRLLLGERLARRKQGGKQAGLEEKTLYPDLRNECEGSVLSAHASLITFGLDQSGWHMVLCSATLGVEGCCKLPR